jgi:hypothetical protein
MTNLREEYRAAIPALFAKIEEYATTRSLGAKQCRGCYRYFGKHDKDCSVGIIMRELQELGLISGDWPE